MKNYVAYGSNMNLEQMEYRCPNSKVIGKGKLKGWKLVFNTHLDIIKTDDFNDEVPVVLWAIGKSDWSRLDMYEGYPSYYTKKIVSVELENGSTVEAVVYVMTDNHKGYAVPFRSYFEGVLEGYNTAGIDTKPLWDALEYTNIKAYEN